MKYFGTDGIRGQVNSGNINGDMFFKFGLAAGKYFTNLKKRKQTAIIAKDTRLSGYALEPALVSGLASAGMHVYTLGPLPTNGLAMLTKSMNANLGIMITASHNLFYDNGLKLFGPDGLKLSDKIQKKIEIGDIEIAPLAFMRGRTLKNSYIIIDEAQNTTKVQMKMLLTRLGEGSKMVITGDLTQVDLPAGQISGLGHSINILKKIKGIEILKLDVSDIVRHPIVSKIIDAYEKN